MRMQTKINAASQEFLKSPNLSKTYTVTYTLSHLCKISTYGCINLQAHA